MCFRRRASLQEVQSQGLIVHVNNARHSYYFTTVFITHSCSRLGAASNKQGQRFRLAAVEGQLHHRLSACSEPSAMQLKSEIWDVEDCNIKCQLQDKLAKSEKQET